MKPDGITGDRKRRYRGARRDSAQSLGRFLPLAEFPTPVPVESRKRQAR
jgi:hypothetical protein